MNKSDIIRNKEDIDKVKLLLRKKNIKYYLFFIIGIETGMSLMQIVLLKKEDLIKNGQVVNYIEKGSINYKINEELRLILLEYFNENPSIKESEFIFKEYKGRNITVVEILKILNVASSKLGLNVKFTSHTLTKTFGFHFYMEYHDIKYLAKIYRHGAYSITEEYIGIKEYK